MNDLAFVLSRSLKVKCDGAIGLSIYGLSLMFNLWPNLAPLRDIRLRNVNDVEFDHLRPLKSYLMVSLDSSCMTSC